MRIALAPNAFRGSLSAFEAIACLERGLQASQLAARDLHCRALPLADGGDGTLEVLLHGLGGSRLRQLVHNPRGHMIHAEYGISSDGTTAIIEMTPRLWARTPLPTRTRSAVYQQLRHR